MAIGLVLARVGEDVMDGEVVEDGENERDSLRNEGRQSKPMVEDKEERARDQHATQTGNVKAQAAR